MLSLTTQLGTNTLGLLDPSLASRSTVQVATNLDPCRLQIGRSSRFVTIVNHGRLSLSTILLLITTGSTNLNSRLR